MVDESGEQEVNWQFDGCSCAGVYICAMIVSTR